MAFRDFLSNLPEVLKPEGKLDFNTKLKWTLIILIAYFILATVPLYGATQGALAQFEFLAIILGTDFGSLISLGIGPIVMASIVLQLLVGAGLLDINLKTSEGKQYFQGLQKLVAIFFCIFESIVYVAMGGIPALPGLTWLVILQLLIGGIMVLFMDEVVSKWGFGSGVSLFIAAGVGIQLFTKAFGILGTQKQFQLSGTVWVFFQSLAGADITGASVAFAAIAATLLIFFIVVWAQSIKVEIPLSFDRLRGMNVKWPLSFFYTSNIPVILAAALIANVQLFARLLESWLGHATILGSFSNGQPVSGLALILYGHNLIEPILRHNFQPINLLYSFIYILFMVGGSILFAVFWVKTSGMDAASLSQQIFSSGMQVPGFRKDPRVLEAILNRYIMPLTIMGGTAVGLLASGADLLGAMVRGTGLLLAVMIIYKLYEDIAQQHAYDMYPSLKKIIKT
jgi:preprotein translocase subunit SecY